MCHHTPADGEPAALTERNITGGEHIESNTDMTTELMLALADS